MPPAIGSVRRDPIDPISHGGRPLDVGFRMFPDNSQKGRQVQGVHRRAAYVCSINPQDIVLVARDDNPACSNCRAGRGVARAKMVKSLRGHTRVYREKRLHNRKACKNEQYVYSHMMHRCLLVTACSVAVRFRPELLAFISKHSMRLSESYTVYHLPFNMPTPNRCRGSHLLKFTKKPGIGSCQDDHRISGG